MSIYYWLTVFSPSAVTFSLGSLSTNWKYLHSRNASWNDFHGPSGQAPPHPSPVSLSRSFFLAPTTSKLLLHRLKHDFQVCFVDRARHWKNSWRQGLTKHKKVDEGGKGALCWLREREKTEKKLRKRKSGHKLWKHFMSKRERKNSFNVLWKGYQVTVIRLSLRLRLIIPTSTLIIMDITKTSSNNCFYKITKIVHAFLLLKNLFFCAG